MDTKLNFASLDELNLDPRNPRIGRKNSTKPLTQPALSEIMLGYSLEELATSYLENGYWPQEAVLCVNEGTKSKPRLIVIEGNRRLAALKFLKAAIDGNAANSTFAEIAAAMPSNKIDFDKIPYIKLDDRQQVDTYLGFRHVTGIKEWKPAEKAEYISYLINVRQMDYDKVRRAIGSQLNTIIRNYFAFQLLKQMEQLEDIDLFKVENKFSVLFLALREKAVQNFLGLNFDLKPKEDLKPVKQSHQADLVDFTRWLFGSGKETAIVSDSRQLTKFSKVLASKEGLKYLRSTKTPNLEYAYQRAGGQEDEVIELIQDAVFRIEESLATVHRHTKSTTLKLAVERLKEATDRLYPLFEQ